MKILSIVGARPEFVQAGPVSRALRARAHEVLVHTGQHYDYLMSDIFVEEMGIAAPDYNLGVGSGSHGEQTGRLLTRLETVMVSEQPDWVIVRGDTNSTLAGALAAKKLGIPVAHIESGARSFDRSMPEELNRVIVDHISDLLFCIAPSGVVNLAAEGIREAVHYVGDVMCDALQEHLPVALAKSNVCARLGVTPGSYFLTTVHRAANTDSAAHLSNIVSALNDIDDTIVFPVHPRTRQALDAAGLTFGPRVLTVDPLGYHDMLALESGAQLILTDSGGVTREAYLLGVPCVTLREETEHVETVESGWNRLVGADRAGILEAVQTFRPDGMRPEIFGDGAAARKIVDILMMSSRRSGQSDADLSAVVSAASGHA